MSNANESDEYIKIWRMKKLIKGLEAARGNGTSMISIIVPPRDQIALVTQKLVEEFGTASNIKSRVNRQSVLGAITSAQQRLKLYNKVPPNGLVLYTGTILMDDGKEKKVTFDFEPFRPINTFLYRCDNKFHTEKLNQLLESGHKFGFIVMDGNGTLFGTLRGNTREVLHKFSVDLPKKHGRGGQSALRFARLRMEKRHNYVRKTAELATQFFIHPSTNQPNVAGLILAGSADFKTELSKADMFDPRLKAIVLNEVDIAYGGENGFNQAIELSSEILGNVKYVMKNSTTGETVIKHLNKKQETDQSNYRDKSTGAELEVEDKMSLLEWFASEYKNFGCTLEFVNDPVTQTTRGVAKSTPPSSAQEGKSSSCTQELNASSRSSTQKVNAPLSNAQEPKNKVVAKNGDREDGRHLAAKNKKCAEKLLMTYKTFCNNNQHWLRGELSGSKIHEGDFSFSESWYHLSDDYPIKYEADRLPPPLVADLNGDGKFEILVATHDAKIQVLEPHSRRVDQSFSEARVLAEVSLLPDKIRVASGRRAVAMATGVIDKFYKPGQPRKQVLVVVTSGWSVMCFDHNLKKLWEKSLQEDFPHNAHHREIAISISNYTLRHGDSGIVLIGGRMEMQPHIFLDPFEEIAMAEKNAEQHRRSAGEKEPSENSGTVDLRHFAFYAFAGRSGVLRWSRKNENIETHSSDASQLIPQHNYKLDANALNSRHPGELSLFVRCVSNMRSLRHFKLQHDCRDFRESILKVLPHKWDRREDTLLKLSHFRRHKRKHVKKTPGKTSNYPFHKPEENNPPGKDPTKKISNLIGKAADYAGSAKSKTPVQYIPTITNYTQLWWVPNVVVAHQKEGIEALHLASGRTLCKLHLAEGGLHADVNGDGVLDHVQAVGGNGVEQTVVSGSMELLRPCWAVATSGVPVREQLFNASICHHTPFNLFQHGEFARHFARTSDVSSLEVATPIFIPKNDGHGHGKRSHGDVVFLTSRGEVTAYSPSSHGHDAIWQWQLLTDATWSNLPSPSGMMEAGMTIPTLKPFSLRLHDDQQMILAAGDQEAVIISPGGSILTSISLHAPPTHALICDDFSNDGLTDIILVTSNGVYGYVQTRQPGALFFSTLVGCLLVVMGLIFVTQHLNSAKKPRISSGPR
ncbi:hypothetical protein ACFE04_024037 [Oxalis oulophora]